MAAGSIVIDLLMKTGSFETDTKRAEKRLKDLDKELKGFAKGVLGATTAAATGFALMAKSSIDNMDNLAKQAQMAGTTVESLSELAYAADLAGVSQEELTTSLGRLSKGMSDAAQGTGEALKGFEALNLDSSAFKGTDDALIQIADRLSQYKDGAEKTAIAISIFGRSGARLIPFLNSGRDGIKELTEEARRLGVVVGTETAKASEQFNDNLSRMNKAIGGIVMSIVSEMLPAMNSFLEKLLEIVKVTKEMNFTAFLPQSSIFATEELKTAKQNVEQLKTLVADLQRQVDSGGGLFVQSSLAANIELLNRAEKTLARISSSIKVGEIEDVQIPKNMPNAPKIGGLGVGKESEYEKAIKSLREQLLLVGQVTEYEKVLANVQLGKYGKLTNQQERQIGLAAQELDATKKSFDTYKEFSSAIDELTGKKQHEEFTKQMGFLAQALSEGRINADEYAKGIDNLASKFKETTSEMGQFAIEAARNIQSTLGDTLFNALDGKFSSISDSFGQMLKKMVAQLAASQLSKLLLGDFDKTGSIGGLLGTAAKAITGAFVPSDVGTVGYNDFFASGGYTGAGGKYEPAGIVHRGEYVINADATKRIGKSRLDMLNGFANGGYVGAPPSSGTMGGNVTINIKNEAGGDGYTATANARKNEAGFDIDVLVRKAVGNDLRNNGPMTQQIGSTFGLRRTA